MVQLKGKGKGKKTAVVKPKKQVKPPPPPKEESSEEEESESEEEEVPKVQTKKQTKTVVKATQEESDDDSDEGEDSDDEEPANGKSANAQEEEEDDDDEEDEEEDEGKEDSDEEDDDEEDSDEEEEEQAPKKAKVKPAAEAMEVDDDEDEEEDDDEEEEEKPQKTAEKSRKRKQDDSEPAAAKKSKTESEGDLVTMLFTNLPEGTTDKSFNKFLNSKGIQCKACRANYGRCKAFIDINTSDKGKALGLHQVEWDGTEISVQAAEPRNQGTDRGDARKDNSDRDSRTLFVKNLPFSASEDDLKGTFENVEEVRFLNDRNTGRPKGIAFVQFDDAASADKVMEAKDDYELEGRQLMIDYTDSRSQKPKDDNRQSFGRGRGGKFGGRGGGHSAPSKTLFVKGVTEDMSKEDFSKYFDTASDVRMITDKETGKNKFFAYVEFESEDAAKKCFTSAKGGIEAEDGSTTFYVDYARERRSDGGSSGFGGGRGRGGRGGFRGRGGGRGRGGRGGGFRGGRGGGRGGGGGGGNKKTTFDDSD